MEFSLVIPAFIAGILTFLAPCTLPLVPAYLGFISGISARDLQDPLTAKQAKRKIFLNGLFFILGFSAVFIILGTVAGLFGQLLFGYRIWLSRIGGIFVMLFGLSMLNVIKIPFLSKEIKIKTPMLFQKGRATNSFVLGATFGLGWTPCVGPILGSILTLAAASTTAFQGGFLLAVFSQFELTAIRLSIHSCFLHFVRFLLQELKSTFMQRLTSTKISFDFLLVKYKNYIYLFNIKYV